MTLVNCPGEQAEQQNCIRCPDGPQSDRYCNAASLLKPSIIRYQS